MSSLMCSPNFSEKHLFLEKEKNSHRWKCDFDVKALWLFLLLLKLLFLLRRFIKLTFKKEIGRNYSRTVLLCPLRLLTTAVIETLEGILSQPPLFLAILCTHKRTQFLSTSSSFYLVYVKLLIFWISTWSNIAHWKR